MALWTGVHLKDTRRDDIDMAVVDNLDEQVRDEGERHHRNQDILTDCPGVHYAI